MSETPILPRRRIVHRVLNRFWLYVLRLNKYVIFSNRLRMMVYRDLLGMRIGCQSIIWAGNVFNDVSHFSMGENCIIGPGNVFLIRGGIEIGSNVNISGFSFFISQSHDVDDPNGHTVLEPIHIGDDAWIATHASILPGVRIGRGAVVAVGSVVTHDVEPYTVVAGNPARPIKRRSPNIHYRLNDTRGMKWL